MADGSCAATDVARLVDILHLQTPARGAHGCLDYDAALSRSVHIASSFAQVNSSSYQAFDSPTYPHLATLGVQIEWNQRYLLNVEGVYRCTILL